MPEKHIKVLVNAYDGSDNVTDQVDALLPLTTPSTPKHKYVG